MTIEWSPRSLRETQEIGEYIAADRPGAAEAWLEGLVATVERLASFPRSGRLLEIDPERDYELREILYGSYRVFYRIVTDRVEILRLVHTRRDRTTDDE
jgi:toxin ParE1/3/4